MMQGITSVTGLKNAIQVLEAEQANDRQLQKEQFYITFESFRPVNLLSNTLESILLSPYLINTITVTTIGLVFN